METQWPLVIFTLFVCLTCGTLSGMSLFALQGKAEKLQFPALIVAAVSLVIGGIGSFLHLEHWERIFNGFGHLSSGITQELIGCVVLAIVMVVWFFALRGGKGVSKVLAWITIILSVLMVIATAHSYMMAARPAWSFMLALFYLANAFVLGAIALWAVAAVEKDEEVEKSAVKLTLIGAVTQLVVDVIYVGVCASATIADVGHYADPTRITTAPLHVDSLASVALTGEGAMFFWGAIIAVLIVAVVAFLAKKKIGASTAYMGVAAVAILVSSLLFRALFYVLGYSVFLLY